jgi:hypothetical protein
MVTRGGLDSRRLIRIKREIFSNVPQLEHVELLEQNAYLCGTHWQTASLLGTISWPRRSGPSVGTFTMPNDQLEHMQPIAFVRAMKKTEYTCSSSAFNAA